MTAAFARKKKKPVGGNSGNGVWPPSRRRVRELPPKAGMKRTRGQPEGCRVIRELRENAFDRRAASGGGGGRRRRRRASLSPIALPWCDWRVSPAAAAPVAPQELMEGSRSSLRQAAPRLSLLRPLLSPVRAKGAALHIPAFTHPPHLPPTAALIFTLNPLLLH